MWSLYRTLSLRYLQQRWSRAVLIVASIALGVATLIATQVLNQTMWAAARTAATPLAGRANLYVSNGESGVRRQLAAELARLPGVQAAEPLVFGRARLPDLGVSRNALVLGIVRTADSIGDNPWGATVDWTIPPDRLAYLQSTIFQGWLSRLVPRVRWVLVGNALNADLQTVPMEQPQDRTLQKLGPQLAAELKTARVHIQPVGPEAYTFIKVGTVRAAGPAGDVVKNMLVMDAADAAELLRLPSGMVTRIDLFLQKGADPEHVRQEAEALLGDQASVRTPEAHDEKLQDVMAGLQLGFALSGAGALVVGLFLVYNALAVSVAERRHEIGILRSLGATRGQVWALFVGEAGLLGLLGAALGVPAGIGLAHVGLKPIERTLSDFLIAVESHPVEITAGAILVAVSAGVVTALLASLVPAVAAAHEEPASAVRRIPPAPRLGHRAIHLASSASLLALGVLAMVLRGYLPARSGTYGGFVLALLGLLLMTPLLSAVVARVLQPLARRFLGLQGRLAADNLVRAPGRTGVVITALAAGVTMFVQTAGIIRSNHDPILEWVDHSLTTALVVSSGSPVAGNGQNLLLPETFGQTIKEALPDEVEAALPLRSRTVDYGNRLVFLVALDAAGFYAADRERQLLPGRDLYPRLCQPGTANAIVSENFAALYHVKPGDDINLSGPNGKVRVQVIGTAPDYSWNRGTVVVDRNFYRKYFNDRLVDQYYVSLRPGANPDRVRDQLLERWEAQHALIVLKRDEVKQHVADQIQRFADIAYSQEVVVGLVAALGVLTALLISVLQRRRELGILRALGATRAQVLRSVLAEALFMGVIGALIGFLLGLAVEAYLVQILLFDETGFLVPTRIPWHEAGIITGMALVVATLAGLGPALRTLHLRIPEAIAYE